MDISLLLPIIVLLMFIPLFLSSRKQKRAQAAMQELQIVTGAGRRREHHLGLRGTVVDASYEDTIDLEIADGVVTTWVRAAIRERIATRDEPAVTASRPPSSTSPRRLPRQGRRWRSPRRWRRPPSTRRWRRTSRRTARPRS